MRSFRKELRIIIKRVCEDSFWYNTNAFEYWKISDVFIRPTTTDIEGISVKEALWVNTPAIASDICERPAGTLLFENRNYLDLKDKVLKIYKKDKYETIDFRENVPDVVNEILKIYNSL